MDTDIDTGKEEMKKELDRATQVDSDTDKEGRKERIRMCHTSGQWHCHWHGREEERKEKRKKDLDHAI